MGQYVQWDQSYSNGIQSFDDQHKRMFELINNLHVAIKEKRAKEAVGETMNGLLDYTRTHFAAEEMVMRSHGYPEFEEHKKLHQQLVAEVNELYLRFDSGEPVLTVELIGFLVNWLKTHIQDTDRRYGPFLIGKGVR